MRALASSGVNYIFGQDYKQVERLLLAELSHLITTGTGQERTTPQLKQIRLPPAENANFREEPQRSSRNRHYGTPWQEAGMGLRSSRRDLVDPLDGDLDIDSQREEFNLKHEAVTRTKLAIALHNTSSA